MHTAICWVVVNKRKSSVASHLRDNYIQELMTRYVKFDQSIWHPLLLVVNTIVICMYMEKIVKCT